MEGEKLIEEPGLREIDSLKPEEQEQYLAVPGWRIWLRSIWDYQDPEYSEAINEAETKPLALVVCRDDSSAYPLLADKYYQSRGKPRPPLFGTRDLPSFLLEPLSEEEVRRIDESGEVPAPLGTIDKPNEILHPAELRELFSTPKDGT